MASPLTLRVDVDMSELIRAAKESGMAVEDLGDSFRDTEAQADAAAAGTTSSLSQISRDAPAAAAGVDQVGTAAEGVGGSMSELGAAAGQALSGDVEGGVSSALASLGGMAAAVGIGGPIGSAILGALGEAVGAWLAQLDLFGEKTKTIREEVSNSLVGIGTAFSEADLESRIQAVITDTERWADANTIAKVTGMDIGDVVAGLAGDADSAAAVSKSYADAVTQIGGAWEQVASKDLHSAEQAIEGVTQGLGDAPAQAAAYDSAMARVGASADKATDKARDLRDELRKPITDPTVRFKVDDSAVTGWHPPMLTIPATVAVRPGKVQLTG